ncbi:DUF4190 domain-containing protein [Streptomyces sp. AC495_CC817]|uniref:DUF4190 domain-containing protein n=1 Tax=Streptomyces sp. AC495_CC817 TaxID=2823900 RepID=UPI0020B6D607|nr:DUF4190 domain-containing protein [Streptomyces sp. AC495_CC817]
MSADEAPIPETPAAPEPAPWTSPQGDAALPPTVVDGTTLRTVTDDAAPLTVVDGATLPTVTDDAVPLTVVDGATLPTLTEDAVPTPTVALDKPSTSTGSTGSTDSVDAAGSAEGERPVGPAGPAGTAAPVPPAWSAPGASTAPAPQAPYDPWTAPADTPAQGNAAASPTPSAPSPHDQMTVLSAPGAFAPPGDRQATPSPAPAPNPFAPPAPGAAGAHQPHPAPHASYPSPVASAPYGAPGAAVPPPPIGPEGPGQVPYGYPQYPGYPGAQAHPGAGYPGPGAGYAWPVLAPPPSNGIGIAAMVLGICAAVLFCLWPFAILLGIMAMIFGFVGRAKARRGEATNPGHALAGIICGAAGILLGIGFIVLIVLASENDGYDSDTDPFDDSYSTSLSLVLPVREGGV